MQLTPWYGTDPIIELDGEPDAVAEPAIRQRRRMVELLAGFGDDDWTGPTRCEAWSVRDLVLHLESTNRFWSFSIEAGLRGEPTRFLTTFDPVASPVQIVEAAGDVSPAETFERFASSTDALVSLLESLDEAGWRATAEAPPGHVATTAVVHHALWDSWIHERDVLLPRDEAAEVRDDEVLACLRYAAALSPAFAVTAGNADRGSLVVDVVGPAATFTVEVADRVRVRAGGDAAPTATLTGGAVDLAEALSIRRPLHQPIPADAAWMFDGLAEVFDAPPASRP